MDSTDFSDKANRASAISSEQKSSAEPYQRHGRTTALDDHSDLQVLKRVKRYLLPKNFVI